jgi:hypothetical protein
MRKYIVAFILCLAVIICRSQSVGVGTVAPDNSAQLDVTSTTKGMLVPRMTSGQMGLIPTPAPGLLVYQTNGVAGFYYNAGTAGAPIWRRVGDEAELTLQLPIAYFTPTTTTFNVPAGIYRIYFEMAGGGAGRGGTYLNGNSSYGGGGGGGGGFAAGYINVTPGEVLTLVIGDRGTNGTNGSPGTDGTDGGTTSISSGATTLIGVTGGYKGLASTISSYGGAGNGGNLSALDVRTRLSTLNTPGLGGSPGLFGPAASVLNGEPGTVYNMGKFNKFISTITGVSGAGATSTLKPYYGLGGGFGGAPLWGYIVLSY